jgi:predicted transcriptional regulator
MELKVENLMIRRFFTVNEEDPIWEVLLKLTEERGVLIACVVDKNNKLKGVVTPKRILKAVALSKFGMMRQPSLEWGAVLSSLNSKYAGEIMGPPICIHPDDDVMDAINLMIDKNIYTLPVVDKQYRVVGRIGFFNIIDSWANSLRIQEEQPE